MTRHTAGLMPLPDSPGGIAVELQRLERELAATTAPRARRLLAIERRRALLAVALESA